MHYSYFFLLISYLLAFGCKETIPSPFYSYSVAKFEKIIEQTDGIVVIDVRTLEETALGKIANAIEIDFRALDFQEKLKKMDLNTPYALYCRSGNRSKKAMEMMKTIGFTKVYDLEGGYLAWSKEH